MDVEKQVQYWKTSGREDMEASKSLLESGHWRHAMYFAHLAIEKLLKAHVTLQTREVPPKTHNLVRLAEMAEIDLSRQHAEFVNTFDVFQLEGRYPDITPVSLDEKTTAEKFGQAQEFVAWLTMRLKA